MQLPFRSPCDEHEGDVAPLGRVMCSTVDEDSRTVPSSPSPLLSPAPLRRESPVPDLPLTGVPSGTCTNDIPGNTRKRKHEEESEEEKAAEEKFYLQEIQRRQKLFMAVRKLISSGHTVRNLPLCYLYGDLLLVPNHYLGSSGVSRGRRRSPPEPNLSTPIGPSITLEASQVNHPKTPPLYHVQDFGDIQSLEEGGFSPEWFADVLHPIISDLNKYGVCVVDDFLGSERADHILDEVKEMHSRGVFRAGEVVSRNVQDQARGMIRGDTTTWVTGAEPHCSSIGQLVTVVDSLVAKANKHHDAGKLANYNITWRTRAMVACYPGRDTHYVKHVDNPNGDGRCITAIYYLNKHWTEEDGGVLRIYPENCADKIAAIEPRFDRMLFFWSDRRNPHEVLPAKITRYAITVWYLDQKEREDYLARETHRAAACT